MNSRLSILLIGIMLASCSPKVIESVRTEVVYRDKVVRDSLYFRDSIFVKEQVKGDTVYLDKFVYKYIYKDKISTDTLIREVHDTTYCNVEVEKPLSWAQKSKIGAFWWLLGLVVLGFRKQIFALIKKIV